MIVFLFLFFFSKIALSGEIDGKGVICKIYGNTIGYFFEENRAYEYKLLGGENELELSKKDIGKYFTNENYIYIDEIKIDRKNLHIHPIEGSNAVISTADMTRVGKDIFWDIHVEQKDDLDPGGDSSAGIHRPSLENPSPYAPLDACKCRRHGCGRPSCCWN